MSFDPVTWAVGYTASKGATTLLARVFDDGAYAEIQAAASKWSSDLPDEIRTPSEALFDIDPTETAEDSTNRRKLKAAIVELHKVPTEEEWFDALLESWEFKREQLGSAGRAHVVASHDLKDLLDRAERLLVAGRSASKG